MTALSLLSSFQTFMLLFFSPKGMRPHQCLHRLGNTEDALSVTLCNKKTPHPAEQFEFSFFSYIYPKALSELNGATSTHSSHLLLAGSQVCESPFTITSLPVSETVAASLQHLR